MSDRAITARPHIACTVYSNLPDQDRIRAEARRKERAAELFLIAARSNLWSVALLLCDANAALPEAA